ncbi:30S ribosome-binding factor RbfA [Litoribacillus peritrichatus]|uniref:Ribosome-binding factor A n=1 Tax=Litoribacillus peritrichatus TaxID=718191 RepID=A0ABP7MWA8_9GAMM
MKEYARTDRVGDFLQKELAQLIQFEIKDPRLGMVTVQEVRVSRDLGYADVFITVMAFGAQTEEAKAEANKDALKVLNNAAGFLRTKIGQSFRARTTPELRFFIDDTLENGMKVSSLIEQAIREDSARRDDSDQD